MTAALLVAVLALSVGACSGLQKTATQGLLVSGETLVQSENTFKNVSAAFVAGCVGKTIPVATCDSYRKFGETFKADYPKAVEAWRKARAANDAAGQAAAEGAIKPLVTQLNDYKAGL